MQSEWRVTSNRINDEKMYAVYRLRDVNEVDHSGNREYATDYTTNRFAAEKIAEELNKIEEETK